MDTGTSAAQTGLRRAKIPKCENNYLFFYEIFSFFSKRNVGKVVHHSKNAEVTGPRRQTGPCRTGSSNYCCNIYIILITVYIQNDFARLRE